MNSDAIAPNASDRVRPRRAERPILGVAIAGLAVGYLLLARSLPSASGGGQMGPATFPLIVGAGLLLCALLLLAPRQVPTSGFAAATSDADAEGTGEESAGGDKRDLLVGAGTILLYVVAWPYLNFLVLAVAFLVLLPTFFRPRAWRTHMVAALVFSVAAVVLFDKVLGIPLPGTGALPGMG